MEKTIKQRLDELLARREYSSSEVRFKLQQAGYVDTSIAAIIDDYVERDFISNTRYRDEKVAALMRKGYGPVYAMQILKQHGISFNPQDYDWSEAYQVARRKAGNKEGMKLKQYLYRRGFQDYR